MAQWNGSAPQAAPEWGGVETIAETLHVLCVSPEPATAAGVAAMLASCGGFTSATRMADYTELGDLRDPDLVIVVLEDDPTAGLAVIQRVRDSARGVHVLAVSPDDDPETMVRVVRAGADGHLSLPLDQRELLKVCIKVLELRRSQTGPKRHGGELWVCYSPKGGVGVTTVAVNLALALRAADRDVALVDLDVHAGDAALFLNLNPSYTLRDVTKNLKRLDSTFVQSTMIRHASGLQILAAPEPGAEPPVELGHEQTLAILDVLTGMHEVTLVDTPGIRCEMTSAALEAADRILLLTELTVPSLRGCLGTLAWLREEGIDLAATVEIVANKQAERSADISPFEAARTLGRPLRALLPRDDAAGRAAANGGKPLSDGTALGRAIAGLATRHPVAAEPTRRRPKFLSLFSALDGR